MFNDIERVGFAGLGAMGAGIAQRLMAAGYTVIGWNRTKAKAQNLIDAGMGWADTPRELAGEVDVLFTMLTNTAAIQSTAAMPSSANPVVSQSSTRSATTVASFATPTDDALS